MPEHDRALAERLHAVIKATAATLSPRTWYGMPAYAKDGDIICFFQPAQKFKTRYATLGFSDKANLDDGAMWPTYYALTELTTTAAERIGALISRRLVELRQPHARPGLRANCGQHSRDNLTSAMHRVDLAGRLVLDHQTSR